MQNFWGGLWERIQRDSKLYQNTQEKIVKPVNENIVKPVTEAVEEVKKVANSGVTKWLLIGGLFFAIILIFRR